MSKYYVDIVNQTWGEIKDVRILDDEPGANIKWEDVIQFALPSELTAIGIENGRPVVLADEDSS